jgi:selenocysteine lyase/cysteine desulfurase
MPLMHGGTGSESVRQEMPDFLPDRAEAGTLNVPGIAGLREGLRYLRRTGVRNVFQKEQAAAKICVSNLQKLGLRVFAGPHQAATVSFLPPMDCEEFAQLLAKQGIAVRAGLHCAPLAHESAGTLETGTVRISFGHDADARQNETLRQAISRFLRR